ncbi:hypothetical protein BV898_14475 [Hypsibius exemplaris]|uniref:Uncharacterized protein n=1 Tax=Hypsibius exemplaris TaxID=2072580 RepID=A0A9X6RJG4_HYPEX|nr:hypothetical protein BV898_14475 [Hypsibius exemplaris]
MAKSYWPVPWRKLLVVPGRAVLSDDGSTDSLSSVSASAVSRIYSRPPVRWLVLALAAATGLGMELLRRVGKYLGKETTDVPACVDPDCLCRQPLPPSASTQKMVERQRFNLNAEALDLNVAVIGRPNSGKSTLIQKLRHALGNTDSDELSSRDLAEPTGSAVFCYDDDDAAAPSEHPATKIGRVRFWGTTRALVSARDFEEHHMYSMDFLLIVIRQRLIESDVKMVLQAFRWGVPFAVVRTHSDLAVDKLVRGGTPRRAAKEAVKTETETEIMLMVTAHALTGRDCVPCFCTSEYEFGAQLSDKSMDENNLIGQVTLQRSLKRSRLSYEHEIA